MYRHKGLTIIELLTFIVLAAIILFFIVPAFMNHPPGPATRASCMNNVRQIGLAMIQYAGDHDDRFPPLVDAAGNMVPAVDNAGFVSMLPARSAFAVLFKEGYITSPRVFVCPSCGERVPEAFPEDIKNAPLQKLILDDANCSYGWDPTKTHAADATCAIIADKPPKNVSPAHEGTAKNNSDNHQGTGQFIFYNDGHCKWATTPRPDAGDDPDIYTGAPGYEKSTTDAKIIR
jgi:competence protein ComGC